LLCGVLVYKVGIFEGLLIAMAVHGIIHYLVFRKVDKMSNKNIVRKYIEKFSGDGGVD
ncbi:MAG: sulfate transporter, partial [Syntrophaceae bacterium]